jgi:hypothetical protein
LLLCGVIPEVSRRGAKTQRESQIEKLLAFSVRMKALVR